MPYASTHHDARAVAVARGRGLLGPEETMADGVARVVEALAAADARVHGFRDAALRDAAEAALLDGRLGLSSQLFAAAGRSDQVAACTVLPRPSGDDDGALRALVADAAAASAAGLGCGVDLTGYDDPAEAARRVNEALLGVHRGLIAADRRPPALMLTCDAEHPRAAAFVDVKADADFRAWVANVSLRFGADADAYERLREPVARAAHRNGEPGVLFGAVADADNPTPGFRLESTAPCAEVFMAPGERCVFVSVNLAAHVRGGAFDWDELDHSAALAVRLADDAVELAIAGAAPVVAARRRVGVGVCGLHSALLALGIPYAVAEPFASTVAERLVFGAHSASAALARVRGPFPAWPRSRWRDAAWLRRKAAHRRGAVAASAWTRLEDTLLASGVRNAVVVAFPPTGIVSELLGVSKSYEPHFDLRRADGALRRDAAAAVADGDRVGADGQICGASEDHLLACARQISPETHLAIHAAFCSLADEAGSKTVNLPAGATPEDVASLFDAARARGLKGLTVFRDGCLDSGAQRG